MNIITLTTDYGSDDYRAAALRGSVLRFAEMPVLPIDVSHTISPFSIVEAAYVLENCYDSFPKGTVHIIGVEGPMPIAGRLLAYAANGHFFIAPDNAVLSLLFENMKIEEVHEVGLLLNHRTRERLARAANHLAEGKPIKEIGPPAEQIEIKHSMRPVVTQDRIRGMVIAIDNYQNAITNISRNLFERELGNRKFHVQLRGNDAIHQISPSYTAVHQGEPLCLFNINGMLEIAVHLGKATELMGIQKEDLIEVVFE